MEADFWIRTRASGILKGVSLNPQDTLGGFQHTHMFSEEV